MLDRAFLRNFEAEEYLEAFLVAAVSSVLGIRLYLYLTGFPRIGFGVFHIAHLMWGGLLMMLSIVILVSFLTRTSKYLGIIIGGVGFGAFIDELGKYITADNNYFYRPTVAIIYILFVLYYLSIQSIGKFKSTSSDEYLANAIELLKEATASDLSKEEYRQAISYLKKVGREDELSKLLIEAFSRVELSKSQQPNIITRLGNKLSDLYRYLISQKYFAYLVIFFFILKSIISVVNIWVVFSPDERLELAISQWGQLISSAVAGILVLIGIFTIFRSRLKAYQIFKMSVLISIFFTQFFAFYRTQFGALIGLLANLLVLAVIRYTIFQQTQLSKKDQRI